MKQKITIFLLALVIIFSLCSSCVIVLPEYSKGLEFLSNGDGTCCVSGLGTCTDIEISIPTTSPVGDRVTGIGGGAFANCDDISSITIPKSVTNIGFCAFKNCTKLTNVIFPDDGSIAVGWGAFENCGNLPYTIYNGAKYLACKNNPCFLLLIADEEGKSPTSFTVLPQTKWIAFGAFIECRKLENITIPKGVTCIGGATFTECDSLTSISVEIDNSKYHSWGNNVIETASKTLIAGCKTSVIPKDGSVTQIGDYAFFCCSITEITIPSSVTKIGEGAFASCRSMNITYQGTKAQWNAISKGKNWDSGTSYTICCLDGNIIS